MTRIAVIGAGLIGRTHLSVLKQSPGYEVAAIADPSAAAATLAKESSLPYYADYARMLVEAKPDGAVIATPNQRHVTVGLACIERGVPILL